MMQKIKSIVLSLKRDHLYRNAFYVIASTAVLAGFGFVFWIFAARLFKPESVGIATTLISVATLIGSFTQLGLNVSLIRYLPKSDNKSGIINSAYIIALIASIIAAVIFILKVNIFSPELTFLKDNPIYIISFIILMAGLSLNSLLESTYIAFRASGNILFKNTITSVLKLLFLFVFFAFGAYGIFSSYAGAVLIASILSFLILIYKHDYKPAFKINMGIVKKLAKFSLGNYISGFLYQAPQLILPLIILNHLHARVAAYYYIDTMILNLLIVIPSATSQTLLSEGAHDESLLKNHLFKAMKITAILLIPSVVVMFLLGGFVLRAFGAGYEKEAFNFLQILTLSSIPMSVVLFTNSIFRINHRTWFLILLNLIGCALILFGAEFFISYGLVGVGVGWLMGQSLSALVFLTFLIKEIKTNYR